MDCILSYHLNPLTCGVAKFNLILARRLGIPVISIFDPAVLSYSRPLLSLKVSEFTSTDIIALGRTLDSIEQHQNFRLFVHEFSGTEIEIRLIKRAEVVYCGNSELIARLRDIRLELVEAWCPGTILDAQLFNNAELSVFSFGMAHKVRSDYYRKLFTLLSQTGKSYCIYLSTALHDGTSFDGSFTAAFEELQEIFGNNIYFMGYLSDTAIYNYLLRTNFFVAFFDKGVRANNTSIHAAMKCGSVVITNLDKHSPTSFTHLDNLLDIHQCRGLPTDSQILSQISDRAKKTAESLGWDALMSKMLGHKNFLK